MINLNLEPLLLSSTSFGLALPKRKVFGFIQSPGPISKLIKAFFSPKEVGLKTTLKSMQSPFDNNISLVIGEPSTKYISKSPALVLQ